MPFIILLFLVIIMLPILVLFEPEEKRERRFLFSSCSQLLENGNWKEKELPEYCVNIFKQLSEKK
jgi:hypothetical protein